MSEQRRRILIVGGVAGGASVAARARRLCESCEIVVFDKGPYVSFANCGLPYYVGDVIVDEQELLIASPELFWERFHIDVRVHNEVLAIDREAREIEVKDLRTGEHYRERYDELVLAPGARAIRPPLPGIDAPGIFALRTIPDSRMIRAWIERKQATRAVVVGGGFIGLEMAENLKHRGLDVAIVEMMPQVLPVIDGEMACFVQEHLEAHGVTLHLGDGVKAFHPQDDESLVVETQSGTRLDADLVILAIGVRPETTLARDAGLALGALGGIKVDASMRTSDPHIWAVGDAVEVKDVVTGADHLMPLAGPANRQGRIAADTIMGRPSQFRGVQGTAVCGLFGLTIATTGCNERSLQKAGYESYEKVYLHPGHHVGYYPGARCIHIKLLFDTQTGQVLGAQAVGEAGAERRIDTIAMAIQMKATVFDLEEAELCYAPQFGAAKDPVNIAGMIAANILRGDLPLARWEELENNNVLVVDVREPEEFAEGSLPGAVNIPLHELRQRIHEFPTDRESWLFCRVGHRAYYAVRALLQHERPARHLPGGLATFQGFSSRP